MSQRRTPARRTRPSRASREANWAFRADDDAVLDALAGGRHASSLREYFGAPAYAELSVLAAAAKRAKPPRGPKVLILPGIMGSKLGGGGGGKSGSGGVLWMDPLQISAGRLAALALPAGRALRAVGVLLFSYARLKLQLRVDGRDAHFHFYDWRLGLDEVGAQLAARIAADDRPVILIAHSMGGLVARMAARMLPKRLVRKLIMLGTPNEGSFAAVQALRGSYPFVRKMALLDHRHSADQLADEVFSTFPGLYHMLPAPRRSKGIDLFDARAWPPDRPAPNDVLLEQAAGIRAALAPADSRMIQIVGVDQDTVIGVRRTAAGFEYRVARKGDGTVPVALARLANLKCYFVRELHSNLANNADVIAAILDLLRRGRTLRLPGRWRAQRAPERCIDDAQLCLEGGDKIDWGRLTSAEREAALDELDSARLTCRVPDAPPGALRRVRIRRKQ